jgi:hypothetical protein
MTRHRINCPHASTHRYRKKSVILMVSNLLAERQVFDAILDVYEKGISEGKDLVVEGSLLATKILRQFKDKQAPVPDTDTKALFFLFVLFSLYKKSAGLPGKDLNRLSEKERCCYLADLGDALPRE